MNKKRGHCDGLIKKIDKSLFIHDCNTLPGSSGGVIINKKNGLVIGLHKGEYPINNNNKVYNVGIFIKDVIEQIILNKNLKYSDNNNRNEPNHNLNSNNNTKEKNEKNIKDNNLNDNNAQNNIINSNININYNSNNISNEYNSRTNKHINDNLNSKKDNDNINNYKNNTINNNNLINNANMIINPHNTNIILAEFNIKKDNEENRIINSYEQVYKENSYIGYKEENENEKEIKENCEIKINDNIIPFCYFYKFIKKGKYTIKYIFKKIYGKIRLYVQWMFIFNKFKFI